MAGGVAVRPLLDVLAGLQGFVEAADPGQVPARDAIDLVRVLDRIGRVAEAAKAAAAGRVAESSLWSKAGHRSPAHWVARETGIGVGEAIRLLETAEAVAAAPVVHEALVAGVVSSRQARAAARAEKAQPGAGERLVVKASSVSVTELETDADRIVAAASSESEAEKSARMHEKRMLRTGVDAEGMGYGHWLLEPAQHARLMALIDAQKDKIFHDARTAGVREPAEAYAADALAALADVPSRSTRSARPRRVPSDAGRGAASGAGGTDAAHGTDDIADTGEDWSFTKMIVRVDLTALDRGVMAPGEVCEIAGQGPIPVADAWRMIDGDAFITSVTTKGTEIDKVIHLGRKPTVLQKTALEWFSAGECSTVGCTNPARIEIDHVADWADTHILSLIHI